MQRFLEGRVAYVTGASDGLGAATARRIAAAGATLVLSARRRDRLEAVAADLARDGAECLALPAALGDEGATGEAVAAALRAFGRIDFLICIGGSSDGIGAPVWEMPPERWRALVDANLSGPFYLIRHVVPAMRRQGGGRLLFLSSSATFRPGPLTGPYAATKAAVNQLVTTLAVALAPDRVSANAFNPGPIDTPTYRNVRGALAGSVPGAWPEARSPDEAADLLLWLCSPEAEGLTGEFVQWDNPNTRNAVELMRTRYCS